MYVRFVVGVPGDRAHRLTGLIRELDDLVVSGRLEPYEEDLAIDLFRWFNIELPIPPYARSNWPVTARAWFRDSATDMISRFRDISAILDNNGRPVRMLRSRRPGAILYEDDWQVVARSRRL